MWWAVFPGDVLAADGGSDRPFARAGEVPEERLYARIQGLGGPVSGLYRRRRAAEFLLWEASDGTVLRYQRLANDAVVEDHRFDAAGWPLSTVVFGDGGPQQVVVHTRPPAQLALQGWTEHPIPGGRVWAPAAPEERPGGGARLTLEGGVLEVWRDERGADVYGDAFRDGLLAGCGCVVADRASAWVDARPGARYRLLVPGADAVDVWAVPLPDGLWLASYRVAAPDDPHAALSPGRALVALVTLGPEASP